MGETQLSQDFKAAVVRWLNNKGYDVVEVTSWYEEIWTNQGCPTCGPETDVEVLIYYKDATGKSSHYTHNGKFDYLLSELLDA